MSSTGKFATYPSLAGRVVVISGGAMGIGASMVEHFAVQGSQVIFLDIQVDAAADLVQRLVNMAVTHTPVFFHCDLTNIDGAIKPTAIKILTAYPKVHALINNAAGTAKEERKPTMDITPDRWDASLSVNLRHQFFHTQALMPGLLAAGAASVINMGSISWAIPATGRWLMLQARLQSSD